MNFKSSVVVSALFAWVMVPSLACAQEAEPPTATAEPANQAQSDTEAPSTGEEDSDKPGRPFYQGGGRLLLTSGVTQIEGAAGGGLTPWAFIGGYGTRDEFGANAFATGVNTNDFSLTSFGGLISYKNRLELSVARQSFNLNALGAALGLGRKFSIRQTVVGAKIKLAGDAVLEQDSLLPQIALGLQYKKNDEGGLLGVVGAKHDEGLDIYVSATKVILSQSLLLNATARLTKANQFGILGFGGKDDKYRLVGEGSAALLLTRKLAIGAEYRMKPNNLGIAKEDDAFDVFVAYAPTRNAAVTLAYTDLGNIVVGGQRGAYASLQLGF